MEIPGASNSCLESPGISWNLGTGIGFIAKALQKRFQGQGCEPHWLSGFKWDQFEYDLPRCTTMGPEKARDSGLGARGGGLGFQATQEGCLESPGMAANARSLLRRHTTRSQRRIKMSKSVRQLSRQTVGGRLREDCSTGGERALGSENLNRQIFPIFLPNAGEGPANRTGRDRGLGFVTRVMVGTSGTAAGACLKMRPTRPPPKKNACQTAPALA
jgi:hypothetical protein